MYVSACWLIGSELRLIWPMSHAPKKYLHELGVAQLARAHDLFNTFVNDLET